MANGLSCLVAICLIASSVTALPNGRVVGGANAGIGQFAHQVSLQRSDGSHTCGGSILNQRFILTAAHCVVVGNGVEAYPAQFYQVRVGSIQYMIGGKLLQIKRIIVNKSYGDFLNDLALLELEEPLEFTNNIQPIALADSEIPNQGEVIISGWGRLYHGGPIPNRLQWNTLKSLTNDDCYKAGGRNDSSLLCLAHEPDNGACNGDSGGPATYEGKLVGVAGFVRGGCGSKYPDGYAKVYHHLEWIGNNMK